jgi:hypothetical protein
MTECEVNANCSCFKGNGGFWGQILPYRIQRANPTFARTMPLRAWSCFRRARHKLISYRMTSGMIHSVLRTVSVIMYTACSIGMSEAG